MKWWVQTRVFDILKVSTGTNRIAEICDQLWAEIELLTDTMTEEHTQVTYTKHELLLMWVNSITCGLSNRANTQVQAEEMKKVLFSVLGGKKNLDNRTDKDADKTTGDSEGFCI